MSKEIKSEQESAYEKGFNDGYVEAKKELEGLIEKRALDLFSSQNWLVNPNHVFQVTKTGIPYLNQEPIKKDKLRDLQQQAKMLRDSELWAILTTLIRQKAIDKAVKESTEYAHVLPGKMMIHNIGLMESLVKYIAEVDLSTIVDSGMGDKKVL